MSVYSGRQYDCVGTFMLPCLSPVPSVSGRVEAPAGCSLFSNISQCTGDRYTYSEECLLYNIAHFTTALLLSCIIDEAGIKVQMGNEHGVRAGSLGKSSYNVCET